MVKKMIKRNSYYKSYDLNCEDKRTIKENYFNPYECNWQSNFKDRQNMEWKCMRSKMHEAKLSKKIK